MSIVPQLEKKDNKRKRKRLSPGDAIQEFLDDMIACDIEDEEREALMRHRDNMVSLLRSDFVKRGLPAKFRLLDDRCDVRGIASLIVSENCLEDLMRHMQCTLNHLPVCRGVLNTLLQVA